MGAVPWVSIRKMVPVRSHYSVILQVLRRSRSTYASPPTNPLSSSFSPGATIPRNAPTLTENESWLNSLIDPVEDNAYHNTDEFQLSTYDPTPASVIKEDQNFQLEVISGPPETKYINVRSPLINFTSLNYLRRYSKHNHTQGNFVDLRIIQCKAGSGGDGAVSFLRDANRRIGPPDGGDGGSGGSIFIQAVDGINSLSKLKAKYVAGDGKAGSSRQLDGAKGRDILITVPRGTVVRWCLDPKIVRDYVNSALQYDPSRSLRELLRSKTIDLKCVGAYGGHSGANNVPKYIQLFREDAAPPGEGWIFKERTAEYHYARDWFLQLRRQVAKHDKMLQLEELSHDRVPIYGFDLDTVTETPVCLLEGGRGGLGNMHFLTSMVRNPRFSERGRPGLEAYFMFELKSIADFGLVGFPNAGKSTILNKISNAKPRIGHWEFTTLRPTIGTVTMGPDKGTFTVADIPGIIEDAHSDRGMGLEFLRHIERAKGWVFVLSLEDNDPLDKLRVLIDELGGLEKVHRKRALVVCNKADIDAGDPNKAKLMMEKYLKVQEFCRLENWDTIPTSALNGENMDRLVEKLFTLSQR